MSDQAETNNVVLPESDTLDLILSVLVEGDAPVLPDAHCTFHFDWNPTTGTGMAYLISINDVEINIPLHPLGIAGALDFMSDMAPKTYDINRQAVTIFRVLLDIDETSGNYSGAIMFNETGDVIQSSPGFVDARLADLKAGKSA